MKKLFIGNLAFATTEAELRQAFEKYGPLLSVKIPMDRETGRSRGFGFIEVENDDQAEAAKNEMSNSMLGGKQIVVNEAKPREDRGGSDRRGDFGGGGSRGYSNGSYGRSQGRPARSRY